jgi:uncharacterized DUF497 family protein
MAVEFQWDAGNVGHLKQHKVTPQEFEEVIRNEPLDLEYETEGGEERFKSLGVTDSGRVLVAVWTIRQERIRAITAYPAGTRLRELFWEHWR